MKLSVTSWSFPQCKMYELTNLVPPISSTDERSDLLKEPKQRGTGGLKHRGAPGTKYVPALDRFNRTIVRTECLFESFEFDAVAHRVEGCGDDQRRPLKSAKLDGTPSEECAAFVALFVERGEARVPVTCGVLVCTKSMECPHDEFRRQIRGGVSQPMLKKLLHLR